MSYRNPEQAQYVPTSGAVRGMQESLAHSVVTRQAKKEKEEAEEAARLKQDRQNEIAWSDHLGNNINGDPLAEGVLESTYAGAGKEYAALQKMISDQPELCESENCSMEIKQLQILKNGPNTSIEMLGTFESFLPTLDEDNVDKTQPLYGNMQVANNIIKGTNGYGSDQGYGVEIRRVKKDGKYTGDQELIFKGPCKDAEEGGCPFGEKREWVVNSSTLARLEKNDGSLLSSTPDLKEQYQGISTTSGIFDKESNGSMLDPSFLAGTQNLNGEFTQTSEDFTWKPTKIYDETTGEYVTYEVPYPKYDIDKIRKKIDGYVSAEVDTMFDPKAGGPNEAIANWNKNLAKTMPKEEIKDYAFLNENGTMNWQAANTDPKAGGFAPGTPDSIYERKGVLKPKVKELYVRIYEDHYMKENVQGWIDQQPRIETANLPQGVIPREIEGSRHQAKDIDFKPGDSKELDD